MKPYNTSDRLRQLMATRHIKQIDILRAALPYAEKAGLKMNRSDISQYVSGAVEPGQKKLAILGKALHVNPVWLMGYDVSIAPDDDDGLYNHPDMLPVISRRVPILGGAACGEPIFDPGDGTEFLSVEPDVLCDFALIARGDSMTGDMIFDGDIVYFVRCNDVQDGQIAAITIDDGVTIKHVSRLRDADGTVLRTQLLSSNPKYAPITIGGPDETRVVRIMGRAIGFYKPIS